MNDSCRGRLHIRLQPAGTPVTPAALDAINQHALVPLAAEDVIVRGALVANDQVDSYYTQFTADALRQVATMLPGKPVMRNHDGSVDNSLGLPVGKWYAATVEQRDGVTWARGLFYMVRDPETDSLARRMDAGIINEVSLAWYIGEMQCSICNRDPMDPMCAHAPGVMYDGQLCVAMMPSVRSVEEASLVWKGGQYGTAIEMPDGPEKRMANRLERLASKRAAAANSWDLWWRNATRESKDWTRWWAGA